MGRRRGGRTLCGLVRTDGERDANWVKSGAHYMHLWGYQEAMLCHMLAFCIGVGASPRARKNSCRKRSMPICIEGRKGRQVGRT